MRDIFDFDWALIFGFMSVMLLIGIVVRAKVAFVQKFLFPSCMIGSLLGLVVLSLKLIDIDPSKLEAVAFHLFNISFISVGLTREDDPAPGLAKGGSFWEGAGWMALTQGVTFPMQAIIGGAFVLLFGAFGTHLFPTFGFLAPLGFNEGPGQALSFGKAWETLGFEHGATLGLTMASLGTFCALFVGVPLARWGLKKGLATNTPKDLSRDFLSGILGKDEKHESAGELTLHPSNIDTLAFQAALVGAIYVAAYFLVKMIGSRVGADIGKMLWGFTFVFGLGIAILVRWALSKLKIIHMVDAGIQRRITGGSVDFLIVATISAIQIPVVRQYILPIFLISMTVAILTTVVTVLLGRRLKEYSLERIVAIYGVVTGTLSNGLLLLRIVDPEFKTPVAYEVAIMNILVAPIIYSCMLLVNAPLWWGWSLWLTMLVFLGLMVLCLIVMRLVIPRGERKF